MWYTKFQCSQMYEWFTKSQRLLTRGKWKIIFNIVYECPNRTLQPFWGHLLYMLVLCTCVRLGGRLVCVRVTFLMVTNTVTRLDARL